MRTHVDELQSLPPKGPSINGGFMLLDFLHLVFELFYGDLRDRWGT
jgi:hypothetical protein